MRLLDGTRQTAPSPDEVEISILGPGFGECVVIHLPGNEWIIIDSCLDLGSKKPSALTYLSALGVDVAQRVSFVVASHWHDDHTRGLGDVVDASESAKFFCAHALGGKEFKTFLELYRRHAAPGGAGIEELLQIIKNFEKRRKLNHPVGPNFASARTSLIDRDSPLRVSLKALSPSSAACLAATAKLSQDVDSKAGSDRFAFPSLSPNDLAVVLSLRVADVHVLLGADLEEVGKADLGWQAVVQEFAGELNGHAGFKIPHHGSENGHYQPVWDSMLTNGPWAVLTPYNRGRSPLPSPGDVARIVGRAPDAFSTARLNRVEFRHNNNVVTRTLREMNVTVLQEPGEQGHVRFRKKINSQDEWTVELFGGAHKLS